MSKEQQPAELGEITLRFERMHTPRPSYSVFWRRPGGVERPLGLAAKSKGGSWVMVAASDPDLKTSGHAGRGAAVSALLELVLDAERRAAE